MIQDRLEVHVYIDPQGLPYDASWECHDCRVSCTGFATFDDAKTAGQAHRCEDKDVL